MLAFYLSLLETDEDRALFEFYFHQHEQSVLKIVMKLLRNQAMGRGRGPKRLGKSHKKFRKVCATFDARKGRLHC